MCWRRPGLLARLAIAVATVAWPVVAGAQVPADPYAACREQFSRAPLDYEPAYCFYRVTLEQRRWDDGERVFAVLIARLPQNPWLVLAHGHVHRTRAPERAVILMMETASIVPTGD